MTMTKIEQTEQDSSKFLLMNQMKEGQVCYCPETDQYVLRVHYGHNHPVFLILDDHETINSYNSSCDMLVRALKYKESVTIKFS